MKLRKIRRSVRIVRTVRIENGFTDRTNRTVREKNLRIVNIVFSRWKRQLVTKWSLDKFVDPYGLYGPYELKMAITDREISCPGSHIWLTQINMASYINSVSFLSKIIFVLRTVGDGFLVMKSVCDIVRRFIAVFYTSYEQSWHGINCHRQY